VGKVRRKHAVEVRDVRFLRANADRPIKMTVPGPFTMSQQAQNDFYKDEAEMALDYAQAVNEEINDLFAAGADIVQVDEPYMQVHPAEARSYGIAALQRALDGIVQRHEALRTTLVYREGTLTQQIAAASPVELKLTDLQSVEAGRRETREQPRRMAMKDDLEQLLKNLHLGRMAEILDQELGVHDLDLEGDEAKGLTYAQALMQRSIERAVENFAIDFDDQLYLPCLWNLPIERKDWVLVDEAQDVNPIRLALIERTLKPGGRLIAVGDPSQSIYAFTGALTDSIERIKTQYQAVELPLSVSYRCPTAVIAKAQTLVPQIEAAPGAIDGEVDPRRRLYDPHNLRGARRGLRHDAGRREGYQDVPPWLTTTTVCRIGRRIC
jgi:hypothetical protein